jgi:hypothetical protein
MIKFLIAIGCLALAALPFVKLAIERLRSYLAFRQLSVLGAQVVYNRSEGTVHVSIPNMTLKDAYGRALVKLAADCTSLDIHGSTVDRAFLESVARLSCLEICNAAGSNICDDMVECFMKLPALHSLDLSSTKISDAGANRLSEHPSLGYLYLRDTVLSQELPAHDWSATQVNIIR